MKKSKSLNLFLFVLLIFSIISGFLFVFVSHPKKYEEIIKQYSSEYNLSASLIASIINVESGYNKDAVSKKGAVGLMQILPTTAKWLTGETQNLLNPNTNIKIGCIYLDYLKKQFQSLFCVLAAYNAGPNKVLIWLEDEKYSKDGLNLLSTPYKETNDYIKRVCQNIKFYDFVY